MINIINQFQNLPKDLKMKVHKMENQKIDMKNSNSS